VFSSVLVAKQSAVYVRRYYFSVPICANNSLSQINPPLLVLAIEAFDFKTDSLAS